MPRNEAPLLKMFSHQVDEQTELRLINRQYAAELFKIIDSNRGHLRRWHPQLDFLRSIADADRAITAWQQQSAVNRAIYAGIWFNGRFCGMINHLSVDWMNRCAVLSYWLDAGHQGKGIMTACCRAFIAHGFNTWKLHRFTIECATENTRSRKIPERLGFKLEGIVRNIEWLHDHFADHAIYGLLHSEYLSADSTPALKLFETEENDAAAARTASPIISFA
ncbi:MAG TPA: GNAT family protein [Verrucomicrobiae bacterium]|jgi:ribosomal-protein-serine acetyltransferase|nr:GNAT family protein [Verrucomicrobiae bacterium]